MDILVIRINNYSIDTLVSVKRVDEFKYLGSYISSTQMT